MGEVLHNPGLRVVVQRAADWERARDLRLEMLRDTPVAYLERLSDAERLDDDVWRERQSRHDGDPDAHAIALVDAEGTWVGQMRAFVDRFGDLVSVWLAAVYLSPAHRGGPGAGLMLRAIEDWTRERGHDELKLEVNDTNDRAIAFYRREGFELTGRTRPYPLDPSSRELEMVKRLG